MPPLIQLSEKPINIIIKITIIINKVWDINLCLSTSYIRLKHTNICKSPYQKHYNYPQTYMQYQFK